MWQRILHKRKRLVLYFLWVLNLFFILWFWQRSSLSLSFEPVNSSWLIALGRLFGLFAVYSVLTQFLLIGRIFWIERVFGFDRLSKTHHYNGALTYTFILLHPLFITLGYAEVNQWSPFEQFRATIQSTWQGLFAGIGFLLFTIVIFFASALVRKKLKYEWWYATHILVYGAVFFVFWHQLAFGTDFKIQPLFVKYWYGLYAFVLGNFILFRMIVPIARFFTQEFRVARVQREAQSTTSIYITGNNLARLKARAGQFIIVRFFAKGFWREAHPFSLSQIPIGNMMRISVKNSGDYTSRISQVPVGARALIEGPYGSFTLRTAQRKKFLFIAGGVGITPIFALIKEVVSQRRDAILLYGNKTSNDIIFKEDLNILAMNRSIRLHTIVSDEPSYPGERGKIDITRIQELVPDFRELEIYICGPKPMIKALKNALRKEGVERDAIHYELFSL